MNKTDFAEKLSQRTNLPKLQAIEVTNAALDILSEALTERDKIQFIGFGSLEAKYAPLRMARNPQTGEATPIPAGYKIMFRASRLLRAKINEGPK